MIRTSHTFALGDLRIDGAVELSPAGLDIVRAVIMRGIATAARGEAKAKEMERAGGGDLVRKSLIYYRNAGAFLRHLLSTTRSLTLNVRDELHALRSVPADAPYPPEWAEYMQLAADLEQPDEPTITARPGRGAGHQREPQPAAHPSGGRKRGRPRKADQ